MNKQESNERNAGAYVGIDLGTSNTVVSFYRNGGFEQVAFRRKKVIPSALYFESRTEIYFGDKALKKGVSDPQHLVTEFKRHIGGKYVYSLPFEDIDDTSSQLTHYIVDTNVLINDPAILDSFSSGEVINLSHSVQQELGYRAQKSETKNAAEIAIDKLSELSDLKNIQYRQSHLDLLPEDFTANTPNDDNDNRILSIAVYVNKSEPNASVVLLTNDKGLQGKAKSIGIDFVDISGFRKQKNISQSESTSSALLVRPEMASQYLLEHIKDESEKAIGTEITNAVITVPANFSQAQVELTKKSAENAGFDEVRILKEPIAAGLSYSIDNTDFDATVLVYDFGGGTFDASILKLGSQKLDVLGVDGDPKLGGHDITDIVKNVIYDRLEDEVGLEMYDLQDSKLSDSDYSRNQSMIVRAAEEAKVDLSEFTTTNISISNLIRPDGDPVNIDFDFSRKEFDDEIIDIRKRSIDVVKQLMTSCSLQAVDIDMVVMAGGSSNIPSIYKSIKETLGKEPKINKDTSLVISEGAVIEALGIWDDSNTIQDRVVYNDKALFDFGVGLKDLKFDVLIPAGTKLPRRIEKTYTTEKDDQEMLEIRAFQRKQGYPNATKTHDKGVSYVDIIRIDKLPPAKIGALNVNVSFELTKDDELKMDVKVVDQTGKEVEANKLVISKASEPDYE